MRRIFLGVVCALIVSPALLAQTIQQKQMVVGSGGGLAIFDQYSNTSIFGQTTSERSSDGTFDNTGGFLGGVEDWMTSVFRDNQIPLVFELNQNYPNPFNPATTIEYSIPQNSWVVIEIYNVLGQRTERLVNEFQNAGRHSVIWRADHAASGMYFYRLTDGDNTSVRKMTLVK